MSMSVGGFNSNFNIMANTTSAKKGQTGQSGLPVFDNGRVWSSLGDFGNGLKSYQKEWEGVYSEKFSGLENSGKITVDEMKEQLESEFAQYGVRFVNSNPRDVSNGQHKVYIDDANMQKMANDPSYRGKVMALMQRELAPTQQGFNYQRNGETVSSSLTGTVISICQENSAYGGIPYSGMARGAPSITVSQASVPTASDRADAKKGKSMLEIIKEMREELEEKLEATREEAKQEAAKKAREEQLSANSDIAEEIETQASTQGVVNTDSAEPTQATPGPSTGGSLDVMG